MRAMLLRRRMFFSEIDAHFCAISADQRMRVLAQDTISA